MMRHLSEAELRAVCDTVCESGSAKRWGWFWLMFLFAPSAMVYAVVRRSEAKKQRLGPNRSRGYPADSARLPDFDDGGWPLDPALTAYLDGVDAAHI